MGLSRKLVVTLVAVPVFCVLIGSGCPIGPSETVLEGFWQTDAEDGTGLAGRHPPYALGGVAPFPVLAPVVRPVDLTPRDPETLVVRVVLFLAGNIRDDGVGPRYG